MEKVQLVDEDFQQVAMPVGCTQEIMGIKTANYHGVMLW